MISGHRKGDKHSAESAEEPISSLNPVGCAAPAKQPGAYATRDRPDKHPQQTRLQHVDRALHSPASTVEHVGANHGDPHARARPHGPPSISGEEEETRNSLRSYPSSRNKRYVSGIGRPTTLV